MAGTVRQVYYQVALLYYNREWEIVVKFQNCYAIQLQTTNKQYVQGNNPVRY
jgi:hypothetical protein